MRIDTSVSSSTRQVLVLSVRDVEMGLGVAIFFGETKVNHVDLISALSNTHEEVVRLDVAVY